METLISKIVQAQWQEWLNDLVSASEAAQLKGVNESSIRKAIRSGRLRGRKIGAVHLVSRAEVEALVVVGHRPRKSDGEQS